MGGGGRQTKAQMRAELTALRKEIAPLRAEVIEYQRIEKALADSDARYRAVVECSIQGIVVQRRGAILFANPAFAAIVGFSHAHDVVGRPLEDFIAVGERDRLRSYMAACLQGEPVLTRYECQGLKADGTTNWLEVMLSVVSWEEEPAVLISLIDVTARKQAEAAVQHSEQFYRTLLTNIQDGVFVIQNERIQFVNDAGARMVGRQPAALIGEPFVSIVAQEDIARLLDGYRQCEMFGQFTDREEFRFVAAEQLRPLLGELRVTRIIYQGAPAMLITLRDITESRHAEETIKQEAEIAAALARVGQELSVSLDTPVVLNQLCRLTTEILACDCSYAFLRDSQKNAYVPVAGYGDTPEQETALRTLSIPESLVVKFEALQREEDAEAVVDSECSPFHPLLRRVGLATALYLVLQRGSQPIGTLCAAFRTPREFTARQKRQARGIAHLAAFALANARLIEELESSNRVKEDFIGTMSHELRTPLHILYGYTELLRDRAFGPLTSEQVDILGRIERNLRDLSTLINTTLDLSRLQNQQVPLTIHEVQIPELLAELEIEVQQFPRHAGVAVSWEYEPGLPSFWTDAPKLKIILKNLLTNALKFTAHGTVRVKVAQRGEEITFSVEDTGSGIAPDVLPSIFEPFSKKSSLTTHPHDGVGLGLYIVQRLCAILGGTVSVKSEVGQGSTFTVWLPRKGKTSR